MTRATEEQKAYMRAYYQQNRDAIRARAALNRSERKASGWVRKQSEKERETQRGYRAAKKEREPMYYILSVAKVRARARGLEFRITGADVPVPETCPVLGIPLKKGAGKHNPCSPSIDRIDSSQGYIPGNVWVISYLANVRKNDQTPREILEFGVRLRLALAARGYTENDA